MTAKNQGFVTNPVVTSPLRDLSDLDTESLTAELDAEFGPEFKPMDFASLAESIEEETPFRAGPQDAARAATVATEPYKTSIAREDFPEEDVEEPA